MRSLSTFRNIRILSGVIALLFFIEQVVWAIPDAPGGGLRFSVDRTFSNPTAFASVTGISRDVAIVDEVYRGPKDIQIYLIQDAHTNASAQFNIASVLESLISKRKIKTVFLEAGDGDVSLSKLKKTSSQSKRISVGEKYVHKGIMQGAEFANLTSKHDFDLWGVEDQQLYEETLRTYETILNSRDKALHYLSEAESLLLVLRQELLTDSALKLYEIRKNFLSQNLSMKEYSAHLEEMANQYKVSIDGFKAFSAFIAIKHAENLISFESAQEQRDAALSVLPENIQRDIENSFISIDDSKKMSQSDQIQGYVNLIREIQKVDLEYKSKYPDLLKFINYMEMFSDFDPGNLLSESDRLTDVLFEKILSHPDQMQIIRISELTDAVRKMIQLSATPEDMLDLQNTLNSKEIDYIPGLLNQYISKLDKFYDKALLSDKSFLFVVESAKKFYELTQQRDQAFVDNISEKVTGSKSKEFAFIAGGYHTPNLKSIFKKRGWSYAILSPVVSHETDQKRYAKILLDMDASASGTADQAMPRQIMQSLKLGQSQRYQALVSDLSSTGVSGEIAASRLSGEPTFLIPQEFRRRQIFKAMTATAAVLSLWMLAVATSYNPIIAGSIRSFLEISSTFLIIPMIAELNNISFSSAYFDFVTSMQSLIHIHYRNFIKYFEPPAVRFVDVKDGIQANGSVKFPYQVTVQRHSVPNTYRIEVRTLGSASGEERQIEIYLKNKRTFSLIRDEQILNKVMEVLSDSEKGFDSVAVMDTEAEFGMENYTTQIIEANSQKVTFQDPQEAEVWETVGSNVAVSTQKRLNNQVSEPVAKLVSNERIDFSNAQKKVTFNAIVFASLTLASLVGGFFFPPLLLSLVGSAYFGWRLHQSEQLTKSAARVMRNFATVVGSPEIGLAEYPFRVSVERRSTAEGAESYWVVTVSSNDAKGGRYRYTKAIRATSGSKGIIDEAGVALLIHQAIFENAIQSLNVEDEDRQLAFNEFFDQVLEKQIVEPFGLSDGEGYFPHITKSTIQDYNDKQSERLKKSEYIRREIRRQRDIHQEFGYTSQLLDEIALKTALRHEALDRSDFSTADTLEREIQTLEKRLDSPGSLDDLVQDKSEPEAELTPEEKMAKRVKARSIGEFFRWVGAAAVFGSAAGLILGIGFSTVLAGFPLVAVTVSVGGVIALMVAVNRGYHLLGVLRGITVTRSSKPGSPLWEVKDSWGRSWVEASDAKRRDVSALTSDASREWVKRTIRDRSYQAMIAATEHGADAQKRKEQFSDFKVGAVVGLGLVLSVKLLAFLGVTALGIGLVSGMPIIAGILVFGVSWALIRGFHRAVLEQVGSYDELFGSERGVAFGARTMANIFAGVAIHLIDSFFTRFIRHRIHYYWAGGKNQQWLSDEEIEGITSAGKNIEKNNTDLSFVSKIVRQTKLDRSRTGNMLSEIYEASMLGGLVEFVQRRAMMMIFSVSFGFLMPIIFTSATGFALFTGGIFGFYSLLIATDANLSGNQKLVRIGSGALIFALIFAGGYWLGSSPPEWLVPEGAFRVPGFNLLDIGDVVGPGDIGIESIHSEPFHFTIRSFASSFPLALSLGFSGKYTQTANSRSIQVLNQRITRILDASADLRNSEVDPKTLLLNEVSADAALRWFKTVVHLQQSGGMSESTAVELMQLMRSVFSDSVDRLRVDEASQTVVLNQIDVFLGAIPAADDAVSKKSAEQTGSGFSVWTENLRGLLFRSEFWIGVLFSSAVMWFVTHEISALTHYAKFIDSFLPIPIISGLVMAVEGDHETQKELALYQRSGNEASFFDNLRAQGLLGAVNYAAVSLGGEIMPATFSSYLENREVQRAKSLYEDAASDGDRLKSWHYLESLTISEEYESASQKHESAREDFLMIAKKYPASAESDVLKSFKDIVGIRHDLTREQVREWFINDYQVRSGDYSGEAPANIGELVELSMGLIELNQSRHAVSVVTAKSSFYAGGPNVAKLDEFEAREYLLQAAEVELNSLEDETIIALAEVSRRLVTEPGYSFTQASDDADEIILEDQKSKIRSDYESKVSRAKNSITRVRQLIAQLNGVQVRNPNLEGYAATDERIRIDRNRENDRQNQLIINRTIGEIQGLLNQLDYSIVDAKLLGDSNADAMNDIWISGMDLDDAKEAYLVKMLPAGEFANPYNMRLFDHVSKQIANNQPLVDLFGADFIQTRIDKIRDHIIETEIKVKESELEALLARFEAEKNRLAELDEYKRIANGNGLVVLTDGSVREISDEEMKGMVRVGNLHADRKKLIPSELLGVSGNTLPNLADRFSESSEVDDSTYVISKSSESGTEYLRVIPGVKALEHYRQQLVYQSEAVQRQDAANSYFAMKISEAERAAKNQIKDPEKYTAVSIFKIYPSPGHRSAEYRLTDEWLKSGQIITLDSLLSDEKYAERARQVGIKLVQFGTEFNQDDVQVTLNGELLIMHRYQPVAVVQFKNSDGSARYSLAEARFNISAWIQYKKDWETRHEYKTAHQRSDAALPISDLLSLRKSFLATDIEEQQSSVTNLGNQEQEIRGQLLTLKEQLVSISNDPATTKVAESSEDKVGTTEEKDPEWTDPETAEDYYVQMIQFQIQSFGKVIQERSKGLRAHDYASTEEETNRQLIQKLKEIEGKIQLFHANGDITEENVTLFNGALNDMKGVVLYGLLPHTDPNGTQFKEASETILQISVELGFPEKNARELIQAKSDFYLQTKAFISFQPKLPAEDQSPQEILQSLQGNAKEIQSRVSDLENATKSVAPFDRAGEVATQRSIESFKADFSRISEQLSEYEKNGVTEKDREALLSLIRELQSTLEFSQKQLDQERTALEFGEALVQQDRRMEGSVEDNVVEVSELAILEYGFLHERLELEAARQKQFSYTATDQARALVLSEQARIVGAFHEELNEAYLRFRLPAVKTISDQQMNEAKQWAAAVGISESEFKALTDKILSERNSDERFQNLDSATVEAEEFASEIRRKELRDLLVLLYNKRSEVDYEMQMVLLERQRESMIKLADSEMKRNLTYWEVHAKHVGVLMAQADISAVPWYRRETKMATAEKRTEAESVYLQEDLNMLSASISPRLPYDTMSGYDSAETEARRVFHQYGGHLTNVHNLEPLLAMRRAITEWYVRGKSVREERQLKSIDAMMGLIEIQERLSDIQARWLERLETLEAFDPEDLTVREKAELARLKKRFEDQENARKARQTALTERVSDWNDEMSGLQRIAFDRHPGLPLSALDALIDEVDWSHYSGTVLHQGKLRPIDEAEKAQLIRVSELPFYQRDAVNEAFVDESGEKVEIKDDMYVVRLRNDGISAFGLVVDGDIVAEKEKERVRRLEYELEVLKIWDKPGDDAKLGYSEAQNYYLWLKYSRFGWKPNLHSMLGSPYWEPMFGVEDGTMGGGKFSLHKNAEDFNQEKIVWNFWRYMQSLDLLGFVVEDDFAELTTEELHQTITASVPNVGDIRSVRDDKDAPVYAGNRVVGYRLRHHMLDNLTTIGNLLEVSTDEQRALLLDKMKRQHLTLDSYVLPTEGGNFKVVRLGTLGATIRTSKIRSELRNNLFFTVQEEDQQDKQDQLNRRLTRTADELEKALFELDYINRELNRLGEYSNKNRENKSRDLERLEQIRDQNTVAITQKIEALKKAPRKPETSSLISQLREQLKDVQISYLTRVLPQNLDTLGEEAERLQDRALHLGLSEDEFQAVVLQHRDRIRAIDRWLDSRTEDAPTKQKLRELLFKHPFDPGLTRAQSQFIQDFENRLALKRQVLNSRSMSVHYLPVLWQRQGVDGPWSKDRLDRLDRGPYAHIVDHIDDPDGGLSHSEDGSYFERSVSHKDVPNGLYYRYHVLDHQLQIVMRFHTIEEVKAWIKEQPKYRGIDPEDIDLSARNRFETELGSGDNAIIVQELSVMQIQDRFGNPKEIITHWTQGLHEEPHNIETIRLHPVPKMVFKVEVSAEEYQRVQAGGVYRAHERYLPDAWVGQSWGGEKFVEYDPTTKKYFVWRSTPRFNELVLETRVRNDDGTPGDKVEAGSERVSWGVALPLRAPVQIPYIRTEPRGYQVKRFDEVVPFKGITKTTYVMEAFTGPGESPIVHTFDQFLPSSSYLQSLAGYAEIVERPQYTGPVPLDFADRHLDNLSLSEQINLYGGVRINGKLQIGISEEEKEGLSAFLRKLIIDSNGEDLDAYYRALETNTWVAEDGSVHQLIYGFEDLDVQLDRIGAIVTWELNGKDPTTQPRDIDEYTPDVDFELQIKKWQRDVEMRFNETAHPRLLTKLSLALKKAEEADDKDAQRTILQKISLLRTTPDMIRPPKNLVMAIQILDRFAGRTKDEELKRQAEIAVLRVGVHPLLQVEKRDEGDFDRFKLVITYLDRHSNQSDSKDDRFGKWITYFEILIRNTETGEKRVFDTEEEKAYLPIVLMRLNELVKPSGPLKRYNGPAKVKAVEVLEFIVQNLRPQPSDPSKPGEAPTDRESSAIKVPQAAPRGEVPDYDSWQVILKKLEATGHYPDEAEVLDLIKKDLKALKESLRDDPMQTDRNLNHVKTRIETFELGAMPKPARLAQEQPEEIISAGSRLSSVSVSSEYRDFVQQAISTNYDRWSAISNEGEPLVLPFVTLADDLIRSEIIFGGDSVTVALSDGQTVFNADAAILRQVRQNILNRESERGKADSAQRAIQTDRDTAVVRELTDAYLAESLSAQSLIPTDKVMPNLAVIFDISEIELDDDEEDLAKLRVDYLMMAIRRAQNFAAKRGYKLVAGIEGANRLKSDKIARYVNAKIRQSAQADVIVYEDLNDIPEGFVVSKASSTGRQTSADAINVGYQNSSNGIAFYEGVLYYAMAIAALTSDHITPTGGVLWDEIDSDFVTDHLLQIVQNYTGINASSREVYLALSAKDKNIFMRLRLSAPKPFLNTAIAAARLAQRVIALSA